MNHTPRFESSRTPARPLRAFPVWIVALVTGLLAPAVSLAGDRPNVLFVTVDTLRADRVSSYGYQRPTTPNIDRLIRAGVRFTQARTIEPLTSPALCSMLTSIYPHEHGSTRNGLRMRAGLDSLPKELRARGYQTAAFVGNWTLRDKLSGLAEHFETYEEVLTRRRWLGLIRGEATAHDLTERAAEWISQNQRAHHGKPFFVWVHYVEPHAPYRLHREHLEQLGLSGTENVLARDRYDTEIAFVDDSVGELLAELIHLDLVDRTLIVFTSDHGESLGEHKYWGHGRHLYEPTLRIPMSVTWPGRIRPQDVDSPALIVDLAPTVLGLLGSDDPPRFRGFDWTAVLDGAPPPKDRQTWYQAHRGAVISKHDSDLARRSGLLEVGVIRSMKKEIYRVEKKRRRFYDLAADPLELDEQGDPRNAPTEELLAWMRTIDTALDGFDEKPPEPLDEESIEQLRSLGYVD